VNASRARARLCWAVGRRPRPGDCGGRGLKLRGGRTSQQAV